MLTKTICIFLLISFTVTSTVAATGIPRWSLGEELSLEGVQLAEATSPPPSSVIQAAGTYTEGLNDGMSYADEVGTMGSMAGGVVIGFALNVIGTAIVAKKTGPAPLSAEAWDAIQGKSAEYVRGFNLGWDNKSRSRKRSARVRGSLLGTAIIVSLFFGGFGLFGEGGGRE